MSLELLSSRGAGFPTVYTVLGFEPSPFRAPETVSRDGGTVYFWLFFFFFWSYNVFAGRPPRTDPIKLCRPYQGKAQCGSKQRRRGTHYHYPCSDLSSVLTGPDRSLPGPPPSGPTPEVV